MDTLTFAEQIEEIKKTIDGIDGMFVVVKILNAIPVPIWFKTKQSIMTFMNDAYEDQYLKPRGYTREDYIGQSDDAVWDEDIAEAFRDNDEACIISGKPIFFDEEIMQEGTQRVRHYFVKFPIKIDNEIYIAGMRQIQAS